MDSRSHTSLGQPCLAHASESYFVAPKACLLRGNHSKVWAKQANFGAQRERSRLEAPARFTTNIALKKAQPIAMPATMTSRHEYGNLPFSGRALQRTMKLTKKDGTYYRLTSFFHVDLFWLPKPVNAPNLDATNTWCPPGVVACRAVLSWRRPCPRLTRRPTADSSMPHPSHMRLLRI